MRARSTAIADALLRRIALRGVRFSAAVLGSMAWLAASLHAQTVNWLPAGGGNWDTTTNWSGNNVVNAVGEFASIGGATGGTISVGSNYTIGGITFANGAGAFTISKTSGPTRTYTLGATGITNNDDSGQTLTGANFRLTLGAASSFNVGSSGALTISTTGGNITTSATNTLTLGGNGSGLGTVSSTIDGTNGTVTKSGNSTWVLSGNNSYTGGTTIAGGTLRAGSANALGTTGTVRFTGGTLQYGSGITNDYSARIGNSTSAIALDTNGNNVTFASSLANTNTGGLTKSGAGTLTLNAANNYTGGTTLNAGTLAVGNNSALGSGTLTIAGGTLSASGGARSLTNNTVANANFTIGGSQDLTLSGTFSLGAGDRTITVDNTGTTTFSGVVSNSFYANFTKAGAGRLVLSNANTYVGPTLINGGTLAITNSGALGTSTFGNTVANGATLELSNNIAVSEGDFTITGTGVSSAGAINNLSGSNTLTGQILLGGAATIKSTAGSLTLASYTDLGAYNLTVAGAGNTTFSSQINSSGGGLIKNDAGTLTLSGANSYTGGTTLAGGTVVANNAVALGTAGTVRFTGGTLQYGSGITTDLSSRIGNSSSAIAVDTNGNNVTFASSLANTNTGGLTKTGSGTLTLSAANNYTGNTTVSGGTINIRNATSLGSGSATVNTGATLEIQGGGVTASNAITLAGGTLRNVSGDVNWFNGNIALTADSTVNSGTLGDRLYVGTTGTTIDLGTKTLTVDGPGKTVFIGAMGTGTAGNLVVNSTGEVWLNSQWQVNNFTGTTTVNRGTLVLATNNAVGFRNTTIRGDITIGNGTDSATLLYATGYGIEKLADNVNVTVNRYGTFNLNSTYETINGLTLNGGTIALGAGGTLVLNGDVNVGSSPDTATVTGYQFWLTPAAGNRNITVANGAQYDDLLFTASVVSGGVTKLGAGRMTFAGNNTYSEATNVNAGVVNIRTDTALGGHNSNDVNAGTTVANGAALEIQKDVAYNGGNDITIGLERLTLNGTGIANDGALRNLAGNNTWNGIVNLASSSRINSDADRLTLNGNVTSANNSNLTVGGSGDTWINGAIGTGTGTLTKDGSGTLTLTGNNSYDGVTTINSGVVNVRHTYGLGTTVAGVTVADGAALQLQKDINYNGGANLTIGNETMSLSGTGIGNTGALRNIAGDNTIGGAITIANANVRINTDAGSLSLNNTVAVGSNTLTVGGAANTTIAGQLTGTASSQLTKDGAGTLTLSNSTNTFAGNVTVSAGTLAMGANNALNSSTIDLQIDSGATMSLVGFAQKIGTLAGLGTLDFGSNSTLTLDGGLSLLEVSQLLGTGTIVVNAGSTLRLGADFNNSGINIQLNGGTLELNGTTTTFGTLSVTGNSIIDFASTDSVVNFTTLSLTSYTLSVANWNDFNDLFIVANDPGNKATAPLNLVTFAPSGSWVGNDTIWTTDYPGQGFDHGNEVRPWKPVPEPSTYGAMLMGAGLALFGLRRWRQQQKK